MLKIVIAHNDDSKIRCSCCGVIKKRYMKLYTRYVDHDNRDNVTAIYLCNKCYLKFVDKTMESVYKYDCEKR